MNHSKYSFVQFVIHHIVYKSLSKSFIENELNTTVYDLFDAIDEYNQGIAQQILLYNKTVTIDRIIQHFDIHQTYDYFIGILNEVYDQVLS